MIFNTVSQLFWKCIAKRPNLVLLKNTRCLSTGASLINVQVDSTTGITTAHLQRPPVNSLSLELVTELTNIMMQVEKDKGKGLVLTSGLTGVFSAGLDLMELYQPNPDRVKAYWTALQDLWLHLYSSTYPTAAAISGHSPGGGCLIACSCDYRVMVKGSFTIGLNETQLGLSVPSWFVDTFRNIVPKRESEMALVSGKLYKTEEAHTVGLIDEIAADNNEAVSKALAFIAKMSKFNLYAMSQTKLVIRYDAIKRLQDNREDDLRVFLKFVNAPPVQKALGMYLDSLKNKKK